MQFPSCQYTRDAARHAPNFRQRFCGATSLGGTYHAEAFKHEAFGNPDLALTTGYVSPTVTDAVADMDGTITGACGTVLAVQNALSASQPVSIPRPL